MAIELCKRSKLPKGWVQVKKGVCKQGDKFWNLQTHEWTTVETDDIGMECDTFDALIRKEHVNG